MSKGMQRGMIPWRGLVIGLGIAAGAWLGMALVPWFVTAAEAVVALLLVIVRPVYWWKRGRHGAKAFVNRHERKQERSDGVMSRYDHMMNFSRTAMRVRWARELQPHRDLGEGSFGALLRNPFFELRCWLTIFREPVTGYARRVGVSNLGWKYLQHNAHSLRVMGPRTGKSQGAGDTAIDHPGPLVMTSTRGEIVRITQAMREQVGPTFIYNVGNVGKIPSDLKWNVLSGCTDLETAQRRARDLMGPIQPNTDRGSWDEKAVNVLGPLMYLAAHRGFGMSAVEKWVAIGTLEEAKQLFFGYIQPEMMRLNDPAGRLTLGGLQLFYATNDRTRTSVSSSLGPVLAWLSNPVMNDLGNSRNVNFDVKTQLLDPNATIYMLGKGNQGGAAALMRALAAEIVFQASVFAEDNGGRLDRALLLSLDELPLTCPGPVQEWVADMGGRGIVMDMIVQQRGQLDMIWGKEGREAIMGGCHVVLFGAGCNSADVVQDFSLLTGTRTELRASMDAKHVITGYSEIEVPVLDPGKFGALQVGEALFLCRGRVDVVRTPQASKRRDVRRVERLRRGRQFARTDAASQAANEEFGEQLEQEEMATR